MSFTDFPIHTFLNLPKWGEQIDLPVRYIVGWLKLSVAGHLQLSQFSKTVLELSELKSLSRFETALKLSDLKSLSSQLNCLGFLETGLN